MYSFNHSNKQISTAYNLVGRESQGPLEHLLGAGEPFGLVWFVCAIRSLCVTLARRVVPGCHCQPGRGGEIEISMVDSSHIGLKHNNLVIQIHKR